MALPKNLADINTNLTHGELKEIVRAIESGEAVLVPGSDSLFAESGGWRVSYLGSEFQVEEMWEVVVSIYLVKQSTWVKKEENLSLFA